MGPQGGLSVPKSAANLPPNRSSVSQQTSTPHTRARSTLRSAQEQLRDIREGDWTWQRRATDLVHSFSSPSQSNESSTDDVPASLVTPPKAEPSVRVYLHHVRNADSIPLILLAYAISATELRRANRMWPTDSIHFRKTLYLPVEECGAKPEPCSPPPKSDDSRSDMCNTSNTPLSLRAETGDWPAKTYDRTILDLDAENLRTEAEPEEWVKIPGIGPVQIVLLPARKLSYFPTPQHTRIERCTSLPTLESLAQQDKASRDSMDSAVSRSSIGSLVEDGVGRMVRVWHEIQSRKKWAKIGKDLIEL